MTRPSHPDSGHLPPTGPCLIALSVSLVALTACITGSPTTPIPPRPELLRLEVLSWRPPDATALRRELSNGIPVYAIPDHELPLVTVTVLFRGGGYLEPEGLEGLADLTAALWPAGGAGDLTAAELDDELARLAAEVTVSIGDTSGSLALDVLSSNLGPALGLIHDLLTRPRFAPERLEQARADALQALRARSDEPETVERLEWLRLAYGERFWLNRAATTSSLAAIGAEDCRGVVERTVRAGNVVVAVSGDFEPTITAGLLEAALGNLPALDGALPPIPQPDPAGEGGVWLLDRPESGQARVVLGHQGLPMGHPDEVPLLAVDQVLGGSFTSRLVSRIRSEEGLAYDVYSLASFPPGYPGTVLVAFQTKPSTCVHAAAVALEVLGGLRRAEVSPAELHLAREVLLARLRERFGSAATAAVALAEDELDGRPPNNWQAYRERVATLTAADLRAAAARHLEPERVRLLVMGDRQAIERGHPDHAETLADLGPGTIHALPQRDPLTLEPIPGGLRAPAPQ